MSRRRARSGRSGAPAPSGRSLAASAQVAMEEWPDGSWLVRRVTGSASTKSYRCPGCGQLVPPATPHVVAWPADGPVHEPAAGGLGDRRHWHAACWQARGRRTPAW